MSKGAELIAAERQRQVEVEGWTPKHDAQHKNGELARAAATYAVPEHLYVYEMRTVQLNSSRGFEDGGYLYDYGPKTAYYLIWPWDDEWYKPKDRLTDLVRAGALIAAEIDRLLVEKAGKQ